MKRYRIVGAVIEREGRYLITQRRESAVLPLLWEFPGGKVEGSETDEVALCREIFHRLGTEAHVGAKVCTVEKVYDDYLVELHLYTCELIRGEPRARAVKDFRWVTSDEFSQYAFTPADKASMDQLLG